MRDLGEVYIGKIWCAVHGNSLHCLFSFSVQLKLKLSINSPSMMFAEGFVFNRNPLLRLRKIK